MKNIKETFLGLSEFRNGILVTADLNKSHFKKRKGLTKKDKILRKICIQLMNNLI